MRKDFEWPDGYRSALVIGIDDVHPESSAEGCDCGGDLEGGVLSLLTDFLERHPQVKITLFVTPDWLYLPQPTGFRFIQRRFSRGSLVDSLLIKLFQRRWPDGRFRIDQEQYRKWCAFIKRKVSDGKLSIGIHGLQHFQTYVRYSAEFLYPNTDECRQKLRTAKTLFNGANLPYTMGFAPPGWGITNSLIDALVSESFNYIAGCADADSPVSPAGLCKGAGIQGLPIYFPSVIKDKLVNVPRNWDLGKSSVERAEQIVKIGGLIGVHGHIADVYHGNKLENGVTQKNVQHLDELLHFLEENHPNKVWFTAFNDVATYLKTLQL